MHHIEILKKDSLLPNRHKHPKQHCGEVLTKTIAKELHKLFLKILTNVLRKLNPMHDLDGWRKHKKDD